ncbi:MAG: hypothetical protein HY048_13575 [Acidobacteria bacterium]|nr:hypothetical protein [Acidobacteriota bacterium]
MTRLVPRAIAIAIAVAGLVDPAITLSGSTRARLAIVQLDPAGPKGPALHATADPAGPKGPALHATADPAGSKGPALHATADPAGPGDAATRARDRLSRDLSSSFEIVPQITSDAAAAIVVGDRYPRESVPDALRVATVTTAPAAIGVPFVKIVRIDAPPEVPPGTAIHIVAEIEGSGVAGRTSDVRVSIAGIDMGRASHVWTAARERWRASFDAVPVGDPPYVVRVAGDDVRAVVVDARRRPLRVEVYEPRPSWASTFVRRALEADPRFQVASVSVTSRGIASRAGDAVSLADPRLDASDVVVIGGLDRLTAADARALDRVMRERGGAVVLLPDARLDAGPARDLIPVELKERLLERPTKLATRAPSPPFEASELLVPDPRYVGRVLSDAPDQDPRYVGRVLSDPPDQPGPKGPGLQIGTLLDPPDQPGPKGPGLQIGTRLPGPKGPGLLDTIASTRPAQQIIASTTGDDAAPVVVSVPRGYGRLVWSGAMDAWRFRANDDGAFDRFWQSTIAGLALQAPAPIDVRVEPSFLEPRETGDVIVRLRSRPVGDAPPVSAAVDGTPIRLRPDPEAGVFRSTFIARDTPGLSRVDVRVDGTSPQSASATIVVENDAHRVDPGLRAALSMLATSHGGIDVTPDRIDAIERWASATVAAPTTTVRRYPMRSAWWIAPFAACLAGEWWMRRRAGQR